MPEVKMKDRRSDSKHRNSLRTNVILPIDSDATKITDPVLVWAPTGADRAAWETSAMWGTIAGNNNDSASLFMNGEL
jgi:hypothetical protein